MYHKRDQNLFVKHSDTILTAIFIKMIKGTVLTANLQGIFDSKSWKPKETRTFLFFVLFSGFAILEPRAFLADERSRGEETGEEEKRERTSGRTREVL